ncbi:MAG: VapC toxin family PIN domain ribonuclease [Marinobacter sp.]|uniref:type II toxin-antitoxin system VapC family toxin n=1 Tax=Marinobacter sp. TaxID=50741 RepID=UPI0034A01A91
MSVLVDTSVWVDHFKRHRESLVVLMLRDEALTHPMVLGELACGTPPAPRERTLGDIGLLRPATQASWNEVMAFIEREKLYGLGCGLVDMSLLASTLMTPGARLWTLEKRLATLAARFNIAFDAD